MLNLKLVSLMLVSYFYGCSEMNVKNSEDKKDQENQQVETKEQDAMSADLTMSGYYIAATSIAKDKIPVSVAKDSSLFHIVMASGDDPLVNGKIEVFSNEIGECFENATTKTCSASKPIKTVSAEDSNFFSIVIKKTKLFYLQISAEGYQTKKIQIDGSKASFLVLNIDLEKDKIVCSNTVSSDSSGSIAGNSSVLEKAAILIDSKLDEKPVILSNNCSAAGGEVEIPSIACPEIYGPVCGEKIMSCKSSPCDDVYSKNKTYENECKLNADGAKLLYRGECNEN